MELPEPVRQFVDEHDVEVTSMESEGITWMFVLQSGPVQAKLVHFDDTDGCETTFEIEDFSRPSSGLFGYVDPETYIYQSVQRAPVMTGRGMMLRFDVHAAKTFEIALGVDDDGMLRLAFFGTNL